MAEKYFKDAELTLFVRMVKRALLSLVGGQRGRGHDAIRGRRAGLLSLT